jgi:hypothetical protein
MLAAEGWGVFEVDDGCTHVAPLSDERRHVMSMGCWCLPELDEGVVIHNSTDLRELREHR